MKKIFRFFRNFLLCIGSLVFILIVSEVFVRFYFFDSQERQMGMKTLYVERKSAFAKEVTGDPGAYSGCSFLETLKAHPFLAYVHKTEGDCVPPSINAQGFMGKPLLTQKDNRFYDVLVLGGSVAAALATGEGESFLEKALKEKVGNSLGKPIRVFNGAFAGWRLPQQAIMSLHYGQAYDAVLAVDGFNESLVPSSFGRVDPTIYYSLVHHEKFGEGLTSLKKQIKMWENVHRSSFGHSYLAYFFFDRLLKITARSVAIDEKLNEDEIFLQGLNAAERQSLFIENFVDRVKAMAAISESRGQKFFHFLQPVPNLYKPLTSKEKRALFPLDVDLYQTLATQLELKVPRHSYDLTRVFENAKGSIYSDRIHCEFDGSGGSPGYEQMSQRISEIFTGQKAL